MKTITYALVSLFLGASSASALVIPVSPSPYSIVHCNQTAQQISCTNGVTCNIQDNSGSAFVHCSNGMTCFVHPTGSVSCNNPQKQCHPTGPNLFCDRGETCYSASPASYSCRL